MTRDQCEIIKAVLYFDIFKYPLTVDELFQNSAVYGEREDFNKDLNTLLQNNFLHEESGYILTLERTAADIKKRIAGNYGAKNILPVAKKYAIKIAKFPFVQGVCLSGSISKNYYDENCDVDFFIITKPGRLWICRTLLIIRYKLLPKKLKRYWCTNYFISTENLTIPDNNSFTGTELAFLIPAVNFEAYKALLANNSWYKLRFPNKEPASEVACQALPVNNMKKFIEAVFSGDFGNLIDTLLLELTLKRWRNKFPAMAEADFELQFRSRKDVCKRHTHGFQNKVLKLWEEKTRSFNEKFNVNISAPY